MALIFYTIIKTQEKSNHLGPGSLVKSFIGFALLLEINFRHWLTFFVKEGDVDEMHVQ